MQSTNFDHPVFTETFTLSDGNKIPFVGMGTWRMTDSDVLTSAIDAALEAGYRHFDCAELYENEEIIGKALAQGMAKYGVKREELWLTSKVPHYSMEYDAAKECIDNSVRQLTQSEDGYLDLVLIHWPTSIIVEAGLENRLTIWKALQEKQAVGKVKSIGVSNFTAKHIQEFLDKGITPTLNQIEIHPLYQEMETIKLCQAHNIALTAYAPLAISDEKLLKNPIILGLSEKYGRKSGQIVLRWATQRGFIVIPKSSQKDHLIENLRIGGFALTPEEVEAVNGLNCGYKTDWDPKDEL
ncbi:hypothetical protein FGO68_gene9067 [Halteria grandinella]|uniref:NADP-dependent oxidoreductase domain-containing protein n=1 Tax=Halteria grandinella TaxID=5974 RepID=A0A8J8NMA3_HALGN|nr:hypothetical protein FGO68_gene9067 [Halteria grandinella]